MSRLLAILMAVITGVLIAAGVAPTREKEKTTSPEGTVRAFYDRVKADDYRGAYALTAPSSNVDFASFRHDIAGRDGSLKTLSQLQNADARMIANHGNEAVVPANLECR